METIGVKIEDVICIHQNAVDCPYLKNGLCEDKIRQKIKKGGKKHGSSV